MRNFFAGLLACALVLCACEPSPYPSVKEWPAGSKITGGTFCFEQCWSKTCLPLPLALPDGGVPVKGTVFREAFVPTGTLGRIHVRSCE